MCKSPSFLPPNTQHRENVFRTEPAKPNLFFPHLTFTLTFYQSHQHLFKSHPQYWNKIPSLALAQCLLTSLPPILTALSVTDLLFGESTTQKKKKYVKAAMAFSPLHILLARLVLRSAISIQAANSQPSPLPSYVLARKSRLQSGNVINSMERKHRLSIIHAPLCCYLWLSFSTHSKRLGQGWPALLFFMLSLSRSDICLLSHCHMRTHTQIHTHTHTHTAHIDSGGEQLSPRNPKHSELN